MNDKVKFISYSGKYPNLCSGTLVVEIDGKRVSFGWTNPEHWQHEEKADYPCFWCSGGRCGFHGNYEDEYVINGPWEMGFSRENEYPPEIWNLLPKILEVMNENVQEGCCGGCL